MMLCWMDWMQMRFLMQRFTCFKLFRQGLPSATGLALLGLAVLFTGCETDVVHRKSVAQLNQSAAEHMAQGDFAGAVARLESALELAPESDIIRYNLSMAYIQAGQTEKGAESLAAFIKANPTDERAWSARQSLAVVYQQLGAERMPVAADAGAESEAPAPDAPPKDEAQARAYYTQSLVLLKELADHTRDEQQQQLITENIRHVEGILTGEPPQMSALPPQ